MISSVLVAHSSYNRKCFHNIIKKLLGQIVQKCKLIQKGAKSIFWTLPERLKTKNMANYIEIILLQTGHFPSLIAFSFLTNYSMFCLVKNNN